MDETYQTKAIILDRQPFREYDTKVSIFCLDKGKLELVARGTKKIESKLSGHLEPISLSNIMIVRGRQFDYVGSAINENAFINIKNDLDKLYLAGKAVKVFQNLVKENERDERLFSLLENFLKILNNFQLSTFNFQLFIDFFILKLLVELGYKPELYNCVVCKKKIVPNNNKFDIAKGGVIHSSCAGVNKNILTITNNCIKVLRLITDNDLNNLLKLNINKKLNKEVEEIISSFYQYHF